MHVLYKGGVWVRWRERKGGRAIDRGEERKGRGKRKKRGDREREGRDGGRAGERQID